MEFLDELLVALGFEYDPEGLEEFKKGIKSTTDQLKLLIKFGAGAAAAITAITTVSAIASDEQGKLAAELGLTTEKVDALQQSMVLSGGSVNGMTGSLRNLTKAVAEASRGTGSGIESFSRLGISVQDTNGRLRDTYSVLLDVSKQMEGLERGVQIDLAGKLGLSESLRLLQKGPEAIQAMVRDIESIGVATEKDAKIAADYNDSLTRTKQVYLQMARILTRSIAPVLKVINDSLVEWFKTNREFIEQNFDGWLRQAASGVKLLAAAVGIFLGLKLAAHLLTFISLIKTFSSTLFAAQLKLLAIPLLILGAFLLIEDAMGFFAGKESVFGDLTKDFPKQKALIDGIASAFNALGVAIQMVVDGWAGLFNAFETFKLDELEETAKNLVSFLKDTGFSIFGIETDLEASQRRAMEPDRISAGDILEMGTRASSNSSSVSIDNIDITVSGAGDPAAVGEAVLNSLQQSIQDVDSVVYQ